MYKIPVSMSLLEIVVEIGFFVVFCLIRNIALVVISVLWVSQIVVVMSLFVNNSTEVALRLACVLKLVVDDFMLSNVEVTWVDDFKVAIVVFSDVTPALLVWFGSEFFTMFKFIFSATKMQIPISEKAVKNINKLIKIHFSDAMLFYFSATPSNVYCFDGSLRGLNILHNMSIDFEFIRVRKFI